MNCAQSLYLSNSITVYVHLTTVPPPVIVYLHLIPVLPPITVYLHLTRVLPTFTVFLHLTAVLPTVTVYLHQYYPQSLYTFNSHLYCPQSPYTYIPHLYCPYTCTSHLTAHSHFVLIPVLPTITVYLHLTSRVTVLCWSLPSTSQLYSPESLQRIGLML